MFARFLTTASLGCAVVFSSVSLSIPARAQDQSYFTYVSEWAVPRAEWANFEKQDKQDDATMQKLVADGTLVSWGDTITRVHEDGGYTHAEWFTATSRANLLKTLELISGSASTTPALISATKHEDNFLHTILHGGKTSNGATGYLRVVYWQAKPGAAEALEAHVKTVLKPMLDQDVANGTLLMYNFDAQEIHTYAPGGYNLALLFADGASIDKFYSELEAAEKQNPSAGDILDNLTVEKEHRDTLSWVSAYQHK
ncbi:MAG: hypothetical protein WCC26_18055 [Terracidiphilus sp.]